ncbi:MAG TPA: transposase [Acidobacteriota bacterium]|nr:transposase [Acidobacteriota bacterium]
MISRTTRGYLTHYETPQGTYLVTFRLNDSLPAQLLEQWKEELQLREKQNKHDKEVLSQYEYDYLFKIENYLDTNAGKCWLKDPEIASVVANTLGYFDHQRYTLHCWTIMPNHVHVLFTLSPKVKLSSVMHSWKSFSAHKANQILSRTGTFWQREYFDRLIRSGRQFEFSLRYVLNNPVNAGLCKEVGQWPWTRCAADYQELAYRFLE